ncbi:hypothetical protein QJQ45_025572 [Haematococcus lacustris]|nr:hypothetical protein QJQ45_025572 [Haematococcus lacustris]
MGAGRSLLLLLRRSGVPHLAPQSQKRARMHTPFVCRCTTRAACCGPAIKGTCSVRTLRGAAEARTRLLRL